MLELERLLPYVRIGYSARLTKRQEVHCDGGHCSWSLRHNEEEGREQRGFERFLDFDKLECADTVQEEARAGRALYYEKLS